MFSPWARRVSEAFHTDLHERLSTRLVRLDELGAHVLHSDWDLFPQLADQRPEKPTPAAVLAPIVKRPEGWTLLLTQRTNDMPTHPGQVAFPGGKVQAGDSGPVAAALREAEEEIGLSPQFVAPLGGIGDYVTGTGFRVTPVVALVEPSFTLTPDPREVADVFETPLSYLFDPANHLVREGEFRGHRRTFYEMPHDGRRIFGVTAGMIRKIYERLYG